MNVKEMQVAELVPYEGNPRKNDQAVDAVAASIKEFGFKVPVIVDRDNVIIAGHTRIKAAKKLGMETVPVVMADDLTPEQVRAFRLADNKTAELAEWDLEALERELAELDNFDMSSLGFDKDAEDWFERRKAYDNEGLDSESEEYQSFVEKFEAKRTTDDCYTPQPIYETIADWVAKEYKADRSRFVRPFYPGGDYQSEKYKQGDIVVDNPPFSILSEIIGFYLENGICFFLFAPGLVMMNYASKNVTLLFTDATITYENGAQVRTGFITNLDLTDNVAKTVPELSRRIKEADDAIRKEMVKDLPVMDYPDEVLTSAMMNKIAHYRVDLQIRRKEAVHIRKLDAMKDAGIYGSGLLLSEKAAAEKAAAEKAAAEKAAAEKKRINRWDLSDREKELVKSLGK